MAERRWNRAGRSSWSSEPLGENELAKPVRRNFKLLFTAWEGRGAWLSLAEPPGEPLVEPRPSSFSLSSRGDRAFNHESYPSLYWLRPRNMRSRRALLARAATATCLRALAPFTPPSGWRSRQEAGGELQDVALRRSVSQRVPRLLCVPSNRLTQGRLAQLAWSAGLARGLGPELPLHEITDKPIIPNPQSILEGRPVVFRFAVDFRGSLFVTMMVLKTTAILKTTEPPCISLGKALQITLADAAAAASAAAAAAAAAAAPGKMPAIFKGECARFQAGELRAAARARRGGRESAARGRHAAGSARAGSKGGPGAFAAEGGRGRWGGGGRMNGSGPTCCCCR
jgi:hypothetical protein